MIRFRLTFPDAPGLISDTYDTVDDANAAARSYRRSGVKVLVDTIDELEIERAIDHVLAQRRAVRPIRWARTGTVTS